MTEILTWEQLRDIEHADPDRFAIESERFFEHEAKLRRAENAERIAAAIKRQDQEAEAARIAEASKSKARSAPKPCPALSEITMLQATVWDNWQNDKRPKGSATERYPAQRYGIDLEIWACDPAPITTFSQLNALRAFRTSTRVIPRMDFSGSVAYLAKRLSISPAFQAELLAASLTDGPSMNYGLFSGKGALKKDWSGGSYIDGQFVRIEMIAGQVSYGSLHLNGDALRLDKWVDHTPIGGPLTDKAGARAVSACRMDLSGLYGYRRWKTN